jgi:hypothetical protein
MGKSGSVPLTGFHRIDESLAALGFMTENSGLPNRVDLWASLRLFQALRPIYRRYKLVNLQLPIDLSKSQNISSISDGNIESSPYHKQPFVVFRLLEWDWLK